MFSVEDVLSAGIESCIETILDIGDDRFPDKHITDQLHILSHAYILLRNGKCAIGYLRRIEEKRRERAARMVNKPRRKVRGKTRLATPPKGSLP